MCIASGETLLPSSISFPSLFGILFPIRNTEQEQLTWKKQHELCNYGNSVTKRVIQREEERKKKKRGKEREKGQKKESEEEWRNDREKVRRRRTEGRNKAQREAIPTAIVRKPCKDCGPISAPPCVREFISPPLLSAAVASLGPSLSFSISSGHDFYGSLGPTAFLSASKPAAREE